MNHTYMKTFRKDVCSVSLPDDFEEQKYEEEEKLGWTVQRGIFQVLTLKNNFVDLHLYCPWWAVLDQI